MGVLDHLIDKSADKIQDGDWVEKGIDKLIKDVIPKIPVEFQETATEDLNRLLEEKESIGLLTSDAYLATAGYLSLGFEDDARALYLRETATFEERQLAIREDARAAYSGSLAREAAWENVKSVTLAFLQDAGTLGLGLLLTLAKGA